MCNIAFDIPEEVLYDTKMSREDAVVFAWRTVALGYYTKNKVSIGYCAQIAGMNEEDFICYLGGGANRSGFRQQAWFIVLSFAH